MIARKLYIAGRYSRRDELKEHGLELASYGVPTTSRWLQENYSLNVQMKELDEETLVRIAKVDIADIDAADGFLFFAEDQNNQPPRGGRHVEFGYALGAGKQMYVIGGPENLFHYLPNVLHYGSWKDFVTQEFGDGIHASE